MQILAEFQNISKHYEQPGSGIRNIILDQISLIISEKESIAIVGPSGSGKSTLLNLLGTLDKPSTGKIILDGKDTVEINDNQVADIRTRFIGHIFQLHYLLPQLTLLENVLLPLLARRDKPDQQAMQKRALELIKSGRMKPAGLAAIELAKKNGRWAAAYDSHRTATVPEDLQAALDKNPKAKAFFATLNSTNRYAILFRLQTAQKAETRARRLDQFIRMLENHEKIHP